MSRILEIVLFLTPFLGFAVWRLLLPSPQPPLWLMLGCGGFVALMLAGLLWLHHLDAETALGPYIPAELHNGRVVSSPNE